LFTLTKNLAIMNLRFVYLLVLSLACYPASLVYSQITTVTNGLVAEYTFNSGNANADFGGVNGTVSNATTTDDRFGCPNYAYNFELLDESLISLGDNFDAIFSAADSSWSISMWFKLDDQNNDFAPMINKYSHVDCGAEQRQFILRMSVDNEIEFFYNSTLQWQNYTSVRGSTIISDTKWHHVVATYDGSDDSSQGLNRVQIYLDDLLENTYLAASGGTLSDIPNGTAYLGIGARLNDVGNYCAISGQNHLWDGALDDIRIYNRILTSTEVSTLFNETNQCAVGIVEIDTPDDFEISVYPNPNSIELNVKIKNDLNSSNYEFRVFTLSGSQVISAVSSSPNSVLNIENLSSGVYILKVMNISSGVEKEIKFNVK
jgi:Concanavalin A-like lectin/glucanases superfamily/Secretion system C-terminal sorting domain